MSASERILDTLLLFASAEGPLPATEVAARLDMPLSTAYRQINLLRRYNFVMDAGRELGFTLGSASLRFGTASDRDRVIAPLALPAMQVLSRETGETVGLMRPMGIEVHCAELVESPQSLRCSFVKGRNNPMGAGASAKALMAFMPAAQCQAIMSQLPAHVDRASLSAALDEIAQTGHAVSLSEVDDGIWGVSAPIFSAPGRMEACVTLMAPFSRLGDNQDHLVSALLETTRTITTRPPM